jgi:hypothetical protein
MQDGSKLPEAFRLTRYPIRLIAECSGGAVCFDPYSIRKIEVINPEEIQK